jgi:hypothetical protein
MDRTPDNAILMEKNPLVEEKTGAEKQHPQGNRQKKRAPKRPFKNSPNR